MPIYSVYRQFGGSIVRQIEAGTPDEAEEKMLMVDDITLAEMLDCVWEKPEVKDED